ncbi:MAG: hypothetical protein H6600_01660 [Flavobacteriales bacterium]|nr:hypothetical protein [Flavobacteriales bacterium]
MKRFLVVLMLLSFFEFSAQDKGQDSITNFEKVDSAHNPKVSLIASAIFPGAGQIYNQLYKIKGQKSNLWWKLPIIYGGVGVAGYFIYTNHSYYKDFHNERLARLDDAYVSTNFAYLSDSQLKVYQDQYERWRNLSIIGGLGVYLLQVIDANVEGHLMHFDTSDDLSFQLIPRFNTLGGVNTVGISMRISF